MAVRQRAIVTLGRIKDLQALPEGSERSAKGQIISKSFWNVENPFLPTYNEREGVLIMEETMKPYPLYPIILGFFILLITSGCGRAAPAPIVNPPAVETSLASTALALAKQTEAANPFTATPSQTLTPTPTATPKISLNGTSLTVREDQSTTFTDHKLGYQLIIPPGWLPVRINEDEYYKAFTHDAVSVNPAMVDFLTKLQNEDSNFFRVIALDVQPERAAAGKISGITVILQFEEKTLEDWANTRSNFANMPGYQLLSKQFQETDSGIRILVREESFNSTTEEKIYRRRVFFSTPTGIITVGFESPLDLRDMLLPDFEQMINSLILADP